MPRSQILPNRQKFRVTITLSDGTKAVEIVYADNARHAKKKALRALPKDVQVAGMIVEVSNGT